MADTVSYDYSQGGAYAGAAGRGLTVLYRVMDAAAIITAAGGSGLASASKITAAESVTAFTLPVGFLACGTVVYVKTAGTAGGTIDIGLPANEQGFDAGVDIATAGGWAASNTDALAITAAGTLISSTASDADNVIVQYNADETTGKFIIAVWGIDFSWLAEIE